MGHCMGKYCCLGGLMGPPWSQMVDLGPLVRDGVGPHPIPHREIIKHKWFGILVKNHSYASLDPRENDHEHVGPPHRPIGAKYCYLVFLSFHGLRMGLLTSFFLSNLIITPWAYHSAEKLKNRRLQWFLLICDVQLETKSARNCATPVDHCCVEFVAH